MEYAPYKDEFLHTNRLGSYSSSTFHYGNTRKYHGLLIASIGQLERLNIVNRVMESIVVEDLETEFSTQVFQKNTSINPNQFLQDYSRNPVPEFKYEVNGIKIKKELILDRDKNLLNIRYQVNSHKFGKLNIKPALANRNIHELMRFKTTKLPELVNKKQYVVVKLNEAHDLIIHTKGEFINLSMIYYNFYYHEEAERGYESTEDLYIPGLFQYSFEPGHSEFEILFELVNSTEGLEKKEFILLKNAYIAEQKEFTDSAKFSLQSNKLNKKVAELSDFLVDQAESFIIKERNHVGVVAGYHWFDEWSRDTFISMHGLLYTTNKFQLAKEILESWGKFLTNGLLPNRILYPEHLNSIDATLWYVVRLYEYCELTKDYSLAEKFLPGLESVFLSFLEGTHGIKVSWNELLEDQKPNSAMTWMDAKVNGKPIINRSGYAVEIQGLWYNFVRILIFFKERFRDATHLTRLRNIKVTMEINFNDIFWNQVQHCLYDVVYGKTIDNSVRPNQIILLTLPFQLVKTNASKKILKTIERYLLTPVGLKTLNKENYQYQGYYQGNQEQRDASYHQGTVWPFLLGFYLKATLLTYKKSENSVLYVQQKLDEFYKFINDHNLNYVPEIFSAESLEPNGCLSQAWSVATLLEAIYEVKS